MNSPATKLNSAKNPLGPPQSKMMASPQKPSSPLGGSSPTSKSFRLEAPPEAPTLKPFSDKMMSPYASSPKHGSVTFSKRGSITGSFVSKPASVASAASFRKSDAVRSMFTLSSGADKAGSAPEVAIRQILKACQYYEEKVVGKDAQFGPGARLVKELAKEVRKEALILEQAQRDSDDAHQTMGQVLESYVDVFNDPEALLQDLSLALNPDQDVEDFQNVVLTPAILREAITAFAKRVVSLQGDRAALQARWARDLAKFEKSMRESQDKHAEDVRAVRAECAATTAERDRELRRALASEKEGSEQLVQSWRRVEELEREMVCQQQAAIQREDRLLARIEELERERLRAEEAQRRSAARGHLRDIAMLQADLLTAMRGTEEPLPC